MLVAEQGWREEGRAEGEEVERDEEYLVQGAEREEHFLCGCQLQKCESSNTRSYVIGVVLLQDPAPALVDVLVALSAAAHTERRIHVHVVAGQVERNEALEHNAPAREGLCQEDQQTRRCAAVRHHV